MPTTATVSLSDLQDALEWLSGDDFPDKAAYASRETGVVHWLSSEIEPEEDLPEDLGDESLYAAVPRKNDLDLGVRLVFRFLDRQLPEAHDTVSEFFRRRGAYARYKDFLERKGLIQAWYDFEARAVEAALREWAEGESLRLKD